MQYVQRRLRLIENYATDLYDNYLEEVIEIHEKFNNELANERSNRKEHREVCSKINDFVHFVEIDAKKHIIDA